MREKLFRGKRIDNGEWVEGSLITDVFYRVGEGNKNSIPYILSVSGIDYDSWEDLDDDYGLYEVDPDTVGQYTGSTDKNGKKIFEGDIVKINVDFCTPPTVNAKRFKKDIGVVCFQESSFVARNGDSIYGMIWITEIIGNVHDSPELMEDKP